MGLLQWVSSLSDLLYQGISTYTIVVTGARALIGNNLLKDLPRSNDFNRRPEVSHVELGSRVQYKKLTSKVTSRQRRSGEFSRSRAERISRRENYKVQMSNTLKRSWSEMVATLTLSSMPTNPEVIRCRERSLQTSEPWPKA